MNYRGVAYASSQSANARMACPREIHGRSSAASPSPFPAPDNLHRKRLKITHDLPEPNIGVPAVEGDAGGATNHSPSTATEGNPSENINSGRHRPDEKSPAISPDLASRLFQIYFVSIHPIWPIIYKPLYSSMTFSELDEKIPRPVAMAMFAIASCVNQPRSKVDKADKVSRARSRRDAESHGNPDEFITAALRELGRLGSNDNRSSSSLNLFEPSITACQTLTILSLQQHGAGKFSRAGALCGLAASMALDLGLHLPYPENDPIEVEVKSRLWWNLFVLEKMISFEMGRPILLRSEETGAQYPSINESDEFEVFQAPWTLFDDTPNPGTDGGRKQRPVMKAWTMSAFHSSIGLAKVLERISREIYSFGSRRMLAENRSLGDERRMAISEDIRVWKENFLTSKVSQGLRDGSSIPVGMTNFVVSIDHARKMQTAFTELTYNPVRSN